MLSEFLCFIFFISDKLSPLICSATLNFESQKNYFVLPRGMQLGNRGITKGLPRLEKKYFKVTFTRHLRINATLIFQGVRITKVFSDIPSASLIFEGTV